MKNWPRITAPEQLARVQGMRGLSIGLSNAMGPLVAGAVLAVGGPAGAFTAAGVLFAASLVILLNVRIASPADASHLASAWRELNDGLRYVRHH